MSEPKFRDAEAQVQISTLVENGKPEPCLWESGNRQFTPRRIVATFRRNSTTVYVSGPRIPVESCGCNCHVRRGDEDESEYSVTYYPGNESKKPPQWIADWVNSVSKIAASKIGVVK